MKNTLLSTLVLALVVLLPLDATGQGGRNRAGRGGGGGGGGKGGGHKQQQATPSITQQASRPSHDRASANISFSGQHNHQRADRRPDRNPGGGGGRGGLSPGFANRPGDGGGVVQGPFPQPQPVGGGVRPNPVNRPGAGGGTVQRPFPRPLPADGGRPDFSNRPGTGGSAIGPGYVNRPGWQDPTYRPVRPDWGNRPNRPYRPERPNVVEVDNVINNVGNVTNVTNINQNINNTIINNFGNHYGDNYLNQNNYDFGGGYHSRPWSTPYDCLHTHWGGGYWNFRYRPRIWVNPVAPVSFGVPIVRYAFANPFITTSTVAYYAGYDYSQPIRVSSVDLSGAVTEEAIRRFDAARVAFRNNNMQQCLQLVDSAIQLVPDDSVMHELRALALFAIGDYETAASIVYAVLGGGPGSDWETIGALYANPETYSRQLSNLSAFVAANPDRTGPRFLLAYHLLVVGRADAAYAQFAEVYRRNPGDQVSESLMQALTQPSPPDLAYGP